MKKNYLQKLILYLYMAGIFFIPFDKPLTRIIISLKIHFLFFFFSCVLFIFLVIYQKIFKKENVEVNFPYLDNILLFLLFSLLSVIINGTYNYRGYRLFFAYCYDFSIFYLTLNIIKGKEEIKIIIKLWALSFFIASIYGLWEYINKISTVNFQKLFEVRTKGFMGDPNYLANVLGFYIVILLTFFIYKINYLHKKIGAILLLLLLLVFFTTLSRGAFLSLGIISLILIYLNYKKIKKFLAANFKIKIILLLFFIIFIIALGYLITNTNLLERIIRTGSTTERYQILFTSLKTFWHYIFIGTGLGNSLYLSKFFWPEKILVVRETVVHNSFWEVFVETGLIGGILFLSIFYKIVKKSFTYFKHTKSKTMLAFLLSLIFLVIHDLTISIQYYIYLWIILGLNFTIAENRIDNV